MHRYIQPLAKEFKRHARPARAAGAKAYMRNQFEFYGMDMQLRRRLCKDYMKKSLPAYKHLAPIVKELWKLPQREYQYFGIELVAALKKQWTMGLIGLAEFMIKHKSWWDTVDYINSIISGPYFQRLPERIPGVTGKWNKSSDIWLQRSSIMFQQKYKNETDTRLLSKYILHCAASKEFFVRKAIGWALREYSKTNPRWVRSFVKQNRLPLLSEREALRLIV